MTLEVYQGEAEFKILSAEEVAQIDAVKQRYPHSKSAILPALWILQHRLGILSAEGMAEIGRALDLPAGPVEAVASFYSMFFFKPHGRYVVEMCTNISCLVQGSGPVLRRFEEQLGVHAGATTPDGLCTLLEVECLGACGGAPAGQVNHQFVENLTAEKVDALVEDMRAGRLPQHPFATGQETADRETLVDLANPGANRVPLPKNGAGGPVMALVKGSHLLVSTESEHPAERGYQEPARGESER
ncbi:MAG TPA: NAD(P)H-dependent oxidoreductase subunit E [Candidatus Dormibacteraeota bacterium]|nr:NAD(P)H-dependent oxidoreductase subunit E [Candidatus Dormibacteraeota bacterium]